MVRGQLECSGRGSAGKERACGDLAPLVVALAICGLDPEGVLHVVPVVLFLKRRSSLATRVEESSARNSSKRSTPVQGSIFPEKDTCRRLL